MLLVVKKRKNKSSCEVKCCLTTSKEKKFEESSKKVNAEEVKTKGANPKSKEKKKNWVFFTHKVYIFYHVLNTQT